MSACQAPDCTATLGERNASGYCRTHFQLGRLGPRRVRHCGDCGTQIALDSIGRCRPCHFAYIQSDPAIAARRVDGSRAAKQDPAVRAKLAKAARRAATPERREITRQWALRNRIWEHARFHTPEANAKRGASVSETRMAWCPPEYRDEAKRMVRNGKKPLVEVKRIIAARVEQAQLKPLLGYAIEAAEYVAVHDRCPVIKLPDGRWRYGTAPKDAEQIVAMAVRKGWQRWDTAALRSAAPAGGRA